MRKSSTEIIDGLTITVLQHPAVPAFLLFAKIGAIAGPSLSKALPLIRQLTSASDQPLNLEKIPLNDIAPALGALLGGVNQDILMDLFSRTSVIMPAGINQVKHDLVTPGAIDAAFEDRFPTLLKAIWFSLRVNFKSFSLGVGTEQPTPLPSP